MTLDHELDTEFDNLNLSAEDRNYVLTKLKRLEFKDKGTHAHSIAAGLLFTRLGRVLGFDPHVCLRSGVLHDIGKTYLPSELLCLKEPPKRDEWSELVKHPELGYQELNPKYPFEAAIVLRHHFWQADPYPRVLFDFDSPLSPNDKKEANYYSRFFALADFYDALTHRRNGRFNGQKNPPINGDARKIVLAANMDQIPVINRLYSEGIFV